MNEKQNEVVRDLMEELRSYAEAIRGDWSDFDGRDLLAEIDTWLSKLSVALGVEYQGYYDAFKSMGGYKIQIESNDKAREEINQRLT